MVAVVEMDALGLRRGPDNYSGFVFFFFLAPAKISRAGIQMGSCGLRVLSVPSSLSCLAALVGTWRARGWGGGWACISVLGSWEPAGDYI